MTEKKRIRFNSSILLGLAVAMAGGIMLLENLGMGFGIRALDYWPLLLVLIGVGKLINYKRPHNIYWGVAFVGIGTLFLLNNLGVISFWFNDLWPILIILVGIAIIRGSFWKSRFHRGNVHVHSGDCCLGHHSRHHSRHHSWHGVFQDKKNTLTDDQLNISTVLGSGDYKISSKAFKGGKVDVVMGECKLDFTETEMDGDRIVLDVSTVMGSIEMRIPSDWELVLEGSPLLGSIQDKTTPPRENGKKCVVNGSSVMGSIEVRN